MNSKTYAGSTSSDPWQHGSPSAPAPYMLLGVAGSDGILLSKHRNYRHKQTAGSGSPQAISAHSRNPPVPSVKLVACGLRRSGGLQAVWSGGAGSEVWCGSFPPEAVEAVLLWTDPWLSLCYFGGGLYLLILCRQIALGVFPLGCFLVHTPLALHTQTRMHTHMCAGTQACTRSNAHARMRAGRQACRHARTDTQAVDRSFASIAAVQNF